MGDRLSPVGHRRNRAVVARVPDVTQPNGDRMRVVIAGGHGQIALQLETAARRRGDEPVGIVRNPDHVADLEADRAAETACSTSRTPTSAAAGRGRQRRRRGRLRRRRRTDSGAARKETVDKGAAVLLADAAEQAGVRRYVMVSAMGTDKADPDSDDVFQVYLRAKKRRRRRPARRATSTGPSSSPAGSPTTRPPAACRSATLAARRGHPRDVATCSPRCSRPTHDRHST